MAMMGFTQGLEGARLGSESSPPLARLNAGASGPIQDFLDGERCAPRAALHGSVATILARPAGLLRTWTFVAAVAAAVAVAVACLRPRRAALPARASASASASAFPFLGRGGSPCEAQQIGIVLCKNTTPDSRLSPIRSPPGCVPGARSSSSQLQRHGRCCDCDCWRAGWRPLAPQGSALRARRRPAVNERRSCITSPIGRLDDLRQIGPSGDQTAPTQTGKAPPGSTLPDMRLDMPTCLLAVHGCR